MRGGGTICRNSKVSARERMTLAVSNRCGLMAEMRARRAFA